MNHPEKASQDDESLLRMRTELKDLLNLSAGARDVLQHLAGLERALKTLGLGAFEGLPSHVLKRTAAQLENVLPQPVPAGIAEIRTRIAKALAAHERAQSAPAVKPAPPPIYFSDDKLQVSETTHTDFMRVFEAAQSKD
ncbi:MAG: hypothetical protein ABL900_03885 [Burkholderiaceae bacterium]